MAKDMAILTVSVITLFVAGFAAYSINGINMPGPQQATAEIKDYTAELKSIQKSLDQVSQKLETLEIDTVKELQKIKTELEEVRLMTSEEQSITQSGFGITLDKITYERGGNVVITVQNALPQKPTTFQLLSAFNELITTKNTYADSTGKLAYTFQLPSFLPAGQYTIKALTEGSNASTLFIITDKAQVTESTSIIHGLSIELDKSEYAPGDWIVIAGSGKPSTSISAELTGPEDEIFTAHASTASDNTYSLVFPISSDVKLGKWTVKVTQGEIEESVTFSIKK